jgi:hypothetical protein
VGYQKRRLGQDFFYSISPEDEYDVMSSGSYYELENWGLIIEATEVQGCQTSLKDYCCKINQATCSSKLSSGALLRILHSGSVLETSAPHPLPDLSLNSVIPDTQPYN